MSISPTFSPIECDNLLETDQVSVNSLSCKRYPNVLKPNQSRFPPLDFVAKRRSSSSKRLPPLDFVAKRRTSSSEHANRGCRLQVAGGRELTTSSSKHANPWSLHESLRIRHVSCRARSTPGFDTSRVERGQHQDSTRLVSSEVNTRIRHVCSTPRLPFPSLRLGDPGRVDGTITVKARDPVASADETSAIPTTRFHCRLKIEGYSDQSYSS